jgi:(1->4)-alpha-D-glucan 1-alpha-D-glucosylmutase
VPDFYQGTEGWDLALVDPDNRRPVDFGDLQAVLSAVGRTPDWPALTAHWTDGRIKLALTHRLLSLRNELASVFRDGAYEPVEVAGPDRDHVLAFSRSAGGDCVVVAVGRHFAGLTDQGRHWPRSGWQAELKPGSRQRHHFRDSLGGEEPCQGFEVAPLFAVLPVAVLRSR